MKFWVLVERLRRGFAYFAVLRPSYFFGALIFFLPLSAINNCFPMLGNLFVEYGFVQGFWFGLALWGAVWAVMLTACLTLDMARDRQRSSAHAWIPDPGKNNRWVSVPMRKPSTFWLFSLLGVPAAAVVIYYASNRHLAGIGFFVGCGVSYVAMSVTSYLVQAENRHYQVFPWKPLGLSPEREVGRFLKFLHRCFSGAMKILLAPDDIFYHTKDGPGLLKEDHFYAALSAVGVAVIYMVVYWLFKPTSWFKVSLENVPPAGFIYALLLPIIWIVSALWAYLSRYRVALYFAIGGSWLLYFAATRPAIEAALGGPTHTYDVMLDTKTATLEPKALLDSLAKSGRKNLIIVAASGGGILAAGWTAQVLTGLDVAYPEFAKELRLISSVSGGSVGTAHYVSALPCLAALEKKERETALRAIAQDAMRSSLASTAYGVAFPDFKRAVFPFDADEAFDRGRLLEEDWRQVADSRRLALQPKSAGTAFQSICPRPPAKDQPPPALLSSWRPSIEQGDRPATIFNTTVMETGERIAITPLETLRNKWSGAAAGKDRPYPERHVYARTLSEFLSADVSGGTKVTQEIKGAPAKQGTCPQFGTNYDIDVWTAARLSATFSYVSPAARAACFDGSKRAAASANSRGLLHLIDGGYHDNYGVASALDWLGAVVDELDTQPLPVERIAFIEIRAKQDIPKEEAQNEWSSAWLGPVWGLLNSWGFAQTSSNDTAVNRAQASLNGAVNRQVTGLKKRLAEMNVEFQSFVFVPEWEGPLSWHLSEEDKDFIRKSWLCPNNQAVLRQLRSFLEVNETQNQKEPEQNLSPEDVKRYCTHSAS